MRNYVIINGVNSLTKTGLAIKELPPISKPSMRTVVEEIDGRDGDLIYPLGYSAYNKELEIGLYGNSYDINDIITFFNASGTIVFSNEPDKYYKFSVYDQIDFEKLIKFKEATINLHMQPFKYKLNEVVKTLSEGDNTVTNEGNIYSKPLISIEGSGNITIGLNGIDIFEIDLSEETEIIIDCEKLEAYSPITDNLLNRIVTGNYELFRLQSGNNTISLDGEITSASIINYMRWV